MKKIFLISIIAVLFLVQISVAQETALCSDSDGADIYSKGRTAGQEAYIFEDVCLSNFLAESVCANNKQTYLLFECQNGCSDGACKFSPQTQTCKQQGPQVSVDGKIYTSKCIKSEKDSTFPDSALKYSCEQNSAGSKIESCGDKICSDASGEPQCISPGAGEFASVGLDESIFDDNLFCQKVGSVTLFNKNLYTDTCENFNPELGYLTSALQYGCTEDNQLATMTLDCKQTNEKCLAGKCVQLNNENEKTNFPLGEDMPLALLAFLGLVGLVVLCVVIFVVHHMHSKLKEDLKKMTKKK